MKFLHAPNKITFFPLFYFTLHTEVNGPEGELQLLRYFYLQLYKIQRTRVQSESPPWRAGLPFNEWPLQLLTHHTYRLYSSCMCWNYRSLKSHFENTIKTFFSDCDNLPSYKNLRPMPRQQDIYCQLQTVQAGQGTGWGGRK